MPLYEYACPHCGTFKAWRAMSESGEPADCPACRQTAPRTLSAPQCCAGSGGERAGKVAGGHVHGPGCGHGHVQAAARGCGSCPVAFD